jgi:hypothetical protein
VTVPDRIYLNRYVPNLQVGGQVVQFLAFWGFPIPSPVVMGRIGDSFRRSVCSFADLNEPSRLSCRSHTDCSLRCEGSEWACSNSAGGPMASDPWSRGGCTNRPSRKWRDPAAHRLAAQAELPGRSPARPLSGGAGKVNFEWWEVRLWIRRRPGSLS